MRLKSIIFFTCLLPLFSSVAMISNASAGEILSRYIYGTSALIIVLQYPQDRLVHSSSHRQKYAGFSPGYKIGPYIQPSYLGSNDRTHKSRIRFQRYAGFVREFTPQCYQCQPYTGFKKTYRGQRYTGFSNSYARPKYLTGFR